jgi:ketosteroid isomerase-like protein
MPSDHRRIIERLLAAQSRGDWDGVFEVMHEDAAFELPFQHTRFEGRDEIVARMAPSVARMEGLTFTDVDVREMAEPGWAIVTFKGKATMATTRRPYRQTYIALFHVVRGKVALFREYFDTLELATACAQVAPVA